MNNNVKWPITMPKDIINSEKSCNTVAALSSYEKVFSNRISVASSKM